MISVDVSLFIQIANFLFLIWVLNIILYRPIRGIIRQRKEKFDKLEINPYPSNSELDIKKLKNCEEYRLRIGKYRFIYQIKNNVLIIIMEKADGRGDIYK